MIAETSQTTRRREAGGTGLLLLISTATIVTVAAEAAFVHWASWGLLAAVIGLIIAFAATIAAAIGRLIDDGEIAAPPRVEVPRAAETREPVAAPSRPALTH